MEPHLLVGEMIRQARSSLGYSQYAVANELVRVSGNDALTREEVARWERGKRIPGPYWRKWICTVLELSLGEVEVAARFARAARWSCEVTRAASVRR
ncbi:hypothetical protein GCM10010522_12780 [Kribbella solani]